MAKCLNCKKSSQGCIYTALGFKCDIYEFNPNWELDKAEKDLGWVVSIKSSEVSVVRKNNYHGLSSYGWPDEDKVILMDFPQASPKRKRFYTDLADVLCGHLNKEHYIKKSSTSKCPHCGDGNKKEQGRVFCTRCKKLYEFKLKENING